ncbi:unnamed protein product, partial [Ixodes pacificus]
MSRAECFLLRPPLNTTRYAGTDSLRWTLCCVQTTQNPPPP